MVSTAEIKSKLTCIKTIFSTKVIENLIDLVTRGDTNYRKTLI